MVPLLAAPATKRRDRSGPASKPAGKLASNFAPQLAKLRKLLKMPVVADIRSMPVEPLADGIPTGHFAESVHPRAARASLGGLS